MENFSEPLHKPNIYTEIQNSVTICDSDPRSDVIDVNEFSRGVRVAALPKDVCYSICTAHTERSGSDDHSGSSEGGRKHPPPSSRSLSPKTRTVYRKDSLESLTCSHGDAEMLRAVTQDILSLGSKIIQELQDEINEFFVKTTEDIAKHIAKIEMKQNQQFESFIQNLHKFMEQDKIVDYSNITSSSSTTSYNDSR